MNVAGRLLLSQSSLQAYVDCPRRFELRHLLNLEWPALETEQALEFEASMRRGEEFHHLLHQHALGIPEQALAATIDDELIGQWWSRYLEWQAEYLPTARDAELTLTTPLGRVPDGVEPFQLTAKFDLLTRLGDGTLLIVDWKTGRPPRRMVLAARLQTIVYRYVLVRAGDWLNDGRPVEPEQIRMLYWFAGDGSTIEFDYDRRQYERDEARLLALAGEMFDRTVYPLTADERNCRFCSYRSLCEREVATPTLEEWEEWPDDPAGAVSLDLDDLEEVTF